MIHGRICAVERHSLSENSKGKIMDNNTSNAVQLSSANFLCNNTKPVLGISECLTGSEVRFNGGHKRSRYCTETLSEYFEFKALCPEVGIGMSVPRPPIRMVANDGAKKPEQVTDIRVIATDAPDEDYAQSLRHYAHGAIPQLQGISGYIFMQKSPSCGVNSSKVYGDKGYPLFSGAGAFADEFMKLMPLVPVIEAGQLNDAGLRENFMTRVFAYHEWLTQVEANLTVKSLLEFHRRHKLQIRIHKEKSMRELGRLLANLKEADLNVVAGEYISIFMDALKQPVRRPQQANLLYRIQKHIKRCLSKEEKAEVMGLIEQYRQGIIPLIVPMTLLKFFVNKYKADTNIAAMEPYPSNLGLQNHI